MGWNILERDPELGKNAQTQAHCPANTSPVGDVMNWESPDSEDSNYKRIGHVIIPKPHCSSREGINSHCRRYDWLIFDVFGQSVQLNITAVDSTPTGR